MYKKTGVTALLILFLIQPLVFSLDQETGTAGSTFENSGLPGFTGGVFYLFNSQTLYAGGTVRFDFFYTLDENRKDATFIDRGRSEIYIAVGLYTALPQRSDGVNLLFNYVFGFNLAFETPSVLARNFLIPYIGLEIGGIYIEGRGNGFMACPLVGINLISLPTFTISIETGFLLNTIAFEEFLSIRPQLTMNFVL
jgi:hypothetical protein